MSHSSQEQVVGSGSNALLQLQQAPRLMSGLGYATWRSNMDVFLQRAGAEGIHRKPMDEAEWKTLDKRVEDWSSEAFNAAVALVGGSSSAGTAITGGKRSA